MLDMKWTGWLVTAIAGCVVWYGVVVVLDAFGAIKSYTNELAFLGGWLVVITLCIAIPNIRRIIRKGQDK